MQLQRFDSVDAFMQAAGPYLLAREAEHNLILGIATSLAVEADTYAGPPLLLTVGPAGGDPAAVAIRTPPHNLLLSEVDDPGVVVPVLVSGLAGETLPGVVGPPAAGCALADAWTGAYGGSWHVTREERIYWLAEVVDPRPGAGSARLADATDRETIGGWLLAFHREALDEEAETGMIERSMESWVRGSRRFWLWEVDGQPVSMVGMGGRTPNGARIGPVYTPPEERGHGYASRLTAAVSRTMLEEGRRYCFLYTDLRNKTANHVYQAIGYRPVTDAVMLRFSF